MKQEKTSIGTGYLFLLAIAAICGLAVAFLYLLESCGHVDSKMFTFIVLGNALALLGTAKAVHVFLLAAIESSGALQKSYRDAFHKRSLRLGNKPKTPRDREV